MFSLGSLVASKGGVQVYISQTPLRSISCPTVVVKGTHVDVQDALPDSLLSAVVDHFVWTVRLTDSLWLKRRRRQAGNLKMTPCPVPVVYQAVPPEIPFSSPNTPSRCESPQWTWIGLLTVVSTAGIKESIRRVPVVSYVSR